ncbi:hypothetical protein [Roseimicrobium sp. ORNL1]|uniref:hypothetical protein n=1 Tax=Roseimicrobium sp. ORNL1 TaxID=2711231 RepID=UPI0013E190CE|nr:hypothetical protein [Roseimicrobium sp. ORNL1]QIF01545.1 hypothetical protein G5S37_08415 [Roseimicrobium sp. ORNL1]
MNLLSKKCLSHSLATLAVAGALLSGTPQLFAGAPSTKGVVPVETKPADPWIHALLQVDISDHYITPRGLNVENEGVIFQPLFLVFWTLYSEPDAFLQDITLTTGVWSSFHTNKSGADPGYWNEFDPIAGLGFKFDGGVKLDLNYTAFKSMVDSYPTSQHMEIKLSYDDSKLWGGGFALNPSVAYWQELEDKATVVFDPSKSDESFYFTIGINPTFKAGPVKLEFPTFINLVGDDFYQQFDGSPGGDGLAVFCTGVKASIPLTFVPKDYGFWSLYAGVKYYHLDNQGLLDGNKVLTPNEHREDLVQFHGGISIFF